MRQDVILRWPLVGSPGYRCRCCRPGGRTHGLGNEQRCGEVVVSRPRPVSLARRQFGGEADQNAGVTRLPHNADLHADDEVADVVRRVPVTVSSDESGAGSAGDGQVVKPPSICTSAIELTPTLIPSAGIQ
jgi:hypothetical protein